MVVEMVIVIVGFGNGESSGSNCGDGCGKCGGDSCLCYW